MTASPLARLRAGLRRTASAWASRFEALVGTNRATAGVPGSPARMVAETLDTLEELLIEADIGVRAAERVVSRIREGDGGVHDGMEVRERVKCEIRRILARADGGREGGGPAHEEGRERNAEAATRGPRVVLVVGVNGTGKTTTVGKLAHRFRAEGASPLICAADTFRAAAVEQVSAWAERAAVDVVRAGANADPAAVVFDAIQAGRARGRGVVIVDTAGRLHTRADLMSELAKIRRVAGRAMPGAPHEVLLVLPGRSWSRRTSTVSS